MAYTISFLDVFGLIMCPGLVHFLFDSLSAAAAGWITIGCASVIRLFAGHSISTG